MRIKFENETERALVEGNYREDVAATIGEGKHALPLSLDVQRPDPPHLRETHPQSVAAGIERAGHRALSRQMAWRACGVEVRDGSIVLKVPRGIALRPDELHAIAVGVERECADAAELTNRANVEHVREPAPHHGPPLRVTFPTEIKGGPMPAAPEWLRDMENARRVPTVNAADLRERASKRELTAALGDVLNRRR